ncbi:MAG TPA: 2-amino-4-hydroxy-6-hydroxymethyldihydropteridine diphosphokinase, partial [Thalassospira sp.]|nr:2-amino-4-hydroxy-6-hydroxymethyldihydropteridine diphosphokinase [Thalassospira sp.]
MNNDTARNDRVILIAFGANLPTEEYGAPADTLKAALRRLTEDGDISVA